MEETQTKSEASQLTQIATEVLSGLLASGDYTVGPESFPPFGEEKRRRVHYRPEALEDAIKLAREIIEKTKS